MHRALIPFAAAAMLTSAQPGRADEPRAAPPAAGVFERFVVAADEPRASAAGAEILKAGG